MANLTAQIAMLSDNLGKLPPSQQSFAASIIAYYDKHNKISPKQAPYIPKLLGMLEPQKTEASIKSFSKVNELFDTAKKNSLAKAKKGTAPRSPKVVFNYKDATIDLSLAPDTGRNPGNIYVKLNGEYAGMISKEGDFKKASSFKGSNIEQLISTLEKFSQNPVKLAKEYGKKFNFCCFCNTEITTKESMSVGYGPICAEKFGLPWG